MRQLIITLAILAASLTSNAQDITLPAPDFTQKSLSMIETLQTRHSVRSYDSKTLTNQQISNLCWAACGMSRDDNHRTAPTAMNRQEIRLYVFTADAVYEYNAKGNTLQKKADGNHRDILAGNGGSSANGSKGFVQEFVLDAPVCLLMVIDFDIFGNQDEKAMQMGCVDAGNVSENINLYCQSVGLVTVPRATHDTEKIRKLLNLSDKQLPIMNNPVGFEKK